MKVETYPKRINYSLMTLDKKRRKPKGTIRECPLCGMNGLRQVYSWNRGRYIIGYHHISQQDAPGETPIVMHSCKIHSTTFRELPLKERKLGRN